jgi:glycine cleavage system H protein
VRVEGDLATIGITDHAQEKLGEIISLDLPEVDSYVERDEPFGSIESAKAVIELISPVSGVVISVNEDITDDIGVINSDPHDTGWMIIVDLEDPEELDDLLDFRGYQEFVIQEAEVD